MSSQKQQIEMSELLAMVPVANKAVRERKHGKTLILYVPIRRHWWMRAMSWLPGVQFRDEKAVALDALGQEVWQLVNGRRNVEQIVEKFAKKHKLRFHEARLSVMHFLQMLMKRNLVAMVGR